MCAVAARRPCAQAAAMTRRSTIREEFADRTSTAFAPHPAKSWRELAQPLGGTDVVVDRAAAIGRQVPGALDGRKNVLFPHNELAALVIADELKTRLGRGGDRKA